MNQFDDAKRSTSKLKLNHLKTNHSQIYSPLFKPLEAKKPAAIYNYWPFKWSRRESNSYLKFRKLLFYPLNYGTNMLHSQACKYSKVFLSKIQ